MKTKLTLSVDKDLAKFAHQIARQDNRSVSSLFSAYLLDRKAQNEKDSVPGVAAMAGSLKRYDIDDSKKAITAGYAKKYTD